MTEFYKQLLNGTAIGDPIARSNMIDAFPSLDLENKDMLIQKGFCEYYMTPKPQYLERPGLEDWLIGPDRKVSEFRWERTWELKELELTSKERQEIIDTQLSNIRKTRDYLLSRTDFYALQDTDPMPDEMKTYRQQLRDLLDNIDDPFNILWPKDPIDPERGNG